MKDYVQWISVYGLKDVARIKPESIVKQASA